MKKPLILLIILFIISFSVTMFSPHVINDEGAYLDIEQMNLYRTETGFAVNTNTSNPALNSHHIFIGLLSNFGGINTFTLAIIYGILLLLGMILIVNAAGNSKYTWTNYALPVALILIFTDFAYTGYFKTLYAVPFATVIMALWVGVMLTICKTENKWYLYLIASVLAVIFGCMGTIYGIIAVVMGLAIIYLAIKNSNKTIKIISIILGIVAIISSIVFVSNYRSADYENSLYNAVFFGISQYDDIAKIGLDSKLNDLNGTFITEEVKETYDLENTFYNKVSYKAIAGYYLTHPGTLFKVIDTASKNAFFKVYDKGSITLYSTVKQTFLPNTVLFVLGFLVVYLGFIIFLFKKHKEIAQHLKLFTTFFLMAITGLAAPVILNGIFEISKGMFVYNMIFDIMMTVTIIGGIRMLLTRQDEAKEKFGVTQ